MIKVTIDGFEYEMEENDRLILKIMDGKAVAVRIPFEDHIASIDVFLDLARKVGYTIFPPVH